MKKLLLLTLIIIGLSKIVWANEDNTQPKFTEETIPSDPKTATNELEDLTKPEKPQRLFAKANNRNKMQSRQSIVRNFNWDDCIKPNIRLSITGRNGKIPLSQTESVFMSGGLVFLCNSGEEYPFSAIHPMGMVERVKLPETAVTPEPHHVDYEKKINTLGDGLKALEERLTSSEKSAKEEPPKKLPRLNTELVDTSDQWLKKPGGVKTNYPEYNFWDSLRKRHGEKHCINASTAMGATGGAFAGYGIGHDEDGHKSRFQEKNLAIGIAWALLGGFINNSPIKCQIIATGVGLIGGFITGDSND